jgi:hypothetical protein
MDSITEPTATAPVPSEGAAKPAEAGLTRAVRWRAPVVAAPHGAASQTRNPSLPTFVGLIILILTFFIVLTSLSIRDQSKSKAAIASVQVAFSGNAVTVEDSPARQDEAIARDYIDGLTRRIQSLVPLMGGKKGPASDRQVLWLPAELAFPKNDAAMAPLFPTVLREVVSSLRGVPARLTPHVEMRLCATGPSDRLRAQAVAIGTALAAELAPLRQFSVGVAPCDPGTIGIAVALAAALEPQPSDAREQAP